MADSLPMLHAIAAVSAALLTGLLVSGVWFRAILRRQRDEIIRLQTRLSEEQRLSEEKLALVSASREQLREEFHVLARDVLDEKSRRFTENSRIGLAEVLRPLQEKITQFEKKIDDSYNLEARERFALAREVRKLQELNVRISDDAVNLTRALRGESKTQGAWGEFILSSILEASGLTEGREYHTQRSFHHGDEHGESSTRVRAQPDVIVHLPENRQVVIDAKVSLTAYERYCASTSAEEQAAALAQHRQSLRNHIRELGEKRYQNLPDIHSLDFVLLFMPIEPAFSLALQHEPELFNFAFERNIVLVGPSTLLATLRTIHNIWRYEHQSRNALEIARQAGALYDKFVGFVDDMDDLGRKLDASQRSYSGLINKLQHGKGNLIARAERLKVLGARASKQQNAARLARADDLDVDIESDSTEQEDGNTDERN